jgi:hypothetical protein
MTTFFFYFYLRCYITHLDPVVMPTRIADAVVEFRPHSDTLSAAQNVQEWPVVLD